MKTRKMVVRIEIPYGELWERLGVYAPFTTTLQKIEEAAALWHGTATLLGEWDEENENE